MFRPLTKIVATIGPASDSLEKIKALIKTGVNVFRFNMKHNTIAWHEARIKKVQAAAEAMRKNVGILIDLQGPELRLETPDKKDFPVKKNQKILFTSSFLPGVKSLCIPQAAFFETCQKETTILIDDGFLEFKALSISPEKVIAVSLQDGVVKYRKAVNLPGRKIKLESLIADDLARLDMASKNNVDFVALSFCRNAGDISILKQEIEKRKMKAHVVAKIESRQALENLEEIVAASDAVMIARGDLGIEIPFEEVFLWQKQIIEVCREAKKPVITATHMLQSMVEYPRPTRAEATDVANAVWSGTDAVMLSAETASGKFPEKAVAAMVKIAAFNEKIAGPPALKNRPQNLTELVVLAASTLLQNDDSPKISAVVIFTESGRSARILSAHRLKIPLIAISESPETVKMLSLSFGVFPFCLKFKTALGKLVKMRIFKKGSHILLIRGEILHLPDLTNTLSVKVIK